jgi:hypothetical protein
MLVNMLVTNAMVFWKMPAPARSGMRNLPQAQHMIDLLMVLREKRRNLTREGQMMQDLLPQLQMAYVSASRQVGLENEAMSGTHFLMRSSTISRPVK